VQILEEVKDSSLLSNVHTSYENQTTSHSTGTCVLPWR